MTEITKSKTPILGGSFALNTSWVWSGGDIYNYTHKIEGRKTEAKWRMIGPRSPRGYVTRSSFKLTVVYMPHAGSP